MLGFLLRKEGTPSRVMWLLSPTGLVRVLSCTLGILPARTWQRSSQGGWETPGIASSFASSQHSEVLCDWFSSWGASLLLTPGCPILAVGLQQL